MQVETTRAAGGSYSGARLPIAVGKFDNRSGYLRDRIHLMVSGKLAASGDYRAIRQQLNDRPFVVRVDATRPRALAAGLVEVEAVESVEIDREGHPGVRAFTMRRPPAGAAGGRRKKLGVRLSRVEPLDDSLESVFEYLAAG